MGSRRESSRSRGDRKGQQRAGDVRWRLLWMGGGTLIPRISLCLKEEDRRDATLHGGGEREADGGEGPL